MVSECLRDGKRGLDVISALVDMEVGVVTGEGMLRCYAMNVKATVRCDANT